MKSIKHIVMQGESIYSISNKYFGNVSQSHTIALVNDLDYPFIDTSGKVYPDDIKVATFGDELVIPIEIQSTDIIDDILEEDAYGKDLLLTSDKTNYTFGHGGDFVTTVSNDLTTVSGNLTLAQDLSHRLMTPKGSILLHPDYGSDLLKMIGEKQYIGWEQKVLVEIQKTFLSDPRVEDVQELAFQLYETGIAVYAKLITPLGLVNYSEYLGGAI